MSSSRDIQEQLAHVDAVRRQVRIAQHVGGHLELRAREGGGAVAELELPTP